MSTEPNKVQKVEEVLGSLEGIQRAEAPAFFYTRLSARMEKELERATGGPVGRLLTRPALSLTVGALILLMNMATIMELWRQDKTAAADAGQAIVAADYSLDTYPVYDETPVEP